MSSYFYAQNNQRQGPVSGARLKELAAAGKITRTDHICRDGDTKWVPAGQVKGLFTDDLEVVPVAEAAPAEFHPAPRAGAGPRFHFRHEGKQAGPFALAELKELAAAGRLLPADFVWQEGTKNWVPAARIDGLFTGRRCQVNGVSFLHPLDWTVKVSDLGNRQCHMITVENDTLSINLSMFPDLVTPEKLLHNHQDSLMKSETMKNVTCVKSASAIGGEKAEGVDFKCTINRLPVSGRLHAAHVGNRSVIMLWQAMDEDFRSVVPVADLVRTSLTIEATQEPAPETERAGPGGVGGAVGSGIDAAMAAYRKGKT